MTWSRTASGPPVQLPQSVRREDERIETADEPLPKRQAVGGELGVLTTADH